MRKMKKDANCINMYLINLYTQISWTKSWEEDNKIEKDVIYIYIYIKGPTAYIYVDI